MLLQHQLVSAYFESDHQIEQKYETLEESEPMQALSNDQSAQIDQQQQHQSQQEQQQLTSETVNERSNEQVTNIQPASAASTLTLSQNDQNRLNEIYNRLASQAHLHGKNFGEDAQTAASHYSLSSNDDSGSGGDSYDSYQGGGGGGDGGLTKITQIPQGSMFAFPDKNGKLEFESMYAKQPYSIVFRTQSMPVKIKQQHHTLPAPEVEFVRSQEEAHRIKHEVIRPVIQEVHEIIQPYRRVVQEVRPVIENVHTIVAKGEKGGHGGGAGGGGGSGGMAYGGGGDHLSGSYSENRFRAAIPEQQASAQTQQITVQRTIQQQPIQHQASLSPNAQQYIQQQFRNYGPITSDQLRPATKQSGRYLQRRFI